MTNKQVLTLIKEHTRYKAALEMLSAMYLRDKAKDEAEGNEFKSVIWKKDRVLDVLTVAGISDKELNVIALDEEMDNVFESEDD